MKVKFRLLVLVLASTAFAARLQAAPHGKIQFKPSPTIGDGSIIAGGTYSTSDGARPKAITLIVIPSMGGLQMTAKAVAPAENKWGPLTVGNLVPGQYWLYARMELTVGGVTETICSPLSCVHVVHQGGLPVKPVGSVRCVRSDPTHGRGWVSVTNKGTYKIDKRGFKATACALSVIPANGGEILKTYTKKGPAPAGGNWGAITIDKLPKGQYLVVGQVTMSDGQTDQAVHSWISLVNVHGE